MVIRPFALERFLGKHEFAVTHLAGASDPEAMTVAELLALEPGAREGLDRLWLGYTETQGHPALREAIAALEPGVAPDDVVVFTGAEEPIFTFMNVALRAGDEVIVHQPTYQSLHEVAVGVGAHVAPWLAREADGWQPDPDALDRLLTPRTKGLVINTPNNPTGVVMSPDRYRAAVDFAERHGLWLFGDEVYRGLEYDGRPLPLAATACSRGVSLGAMAKVYGLAGLRIGWLTTKDAALRAQLLAFKDYLSICASAPGEYLATVALRHAAHLAGRARAQVQANLTRFLATLAAHPRTLSWVRPNAGTTGFVRASEPTEPLCERLIAEAGVLLAPGAFFSGHDHHVRVGLGRRSFGDAMNALEAWLRVNRR